MTKYIVTRSQHSVGGGSGFGGPDRYLALVGVPDGVEFNQSTPLHRDRLAKLGIEVEVVGEYYGMHTGPRSSYAKLVTRAEDAGGVWA